MKNQLRLVFKSSKFVAGFVIIIAMVLTAVLFPLLSTADPLKMTGGLFYKPGTYISVADAIETKQYTLDMDYMTNKLEKNISEDDRQLMREWLTYYGIPSDRIAEAKTSQELVVLWLKNYDPEYRIQADGVTMAYRKKFPRLYEKLQNILHDTGYVFSKKDAQTGELKTVGEVGTNIYINTKDIPNQKTFILGTDNFGRDMLVELIHAIGSSLLIGLVAGTVATLIGLIVGLLSGFVGGLLDNILTFITNLFTVIPSFVILVLIAFSLGDQARNIMTVAFVIGITAWPWTARSVRAQAISLRNRDHVNLSKLAGHSMVKIIAGDILPYVASYVVMAYILQVATGILAEAQLSMLGLGPSTSKIATLGLMLNWSMQFQAPLSGAWWAFLPVILSIALITFSLNLMNTGLDQVFNPQLRD